MQDRRQRAMIIDKDKTAEFLRVLKETIPTKEFWDECKESTKNIDMKRLNELYDRFQK